ncbi:MAG: ATP-binding cassette domain-containing protein [Planctomycetota bacterium]
MRVEFQSVGKRFGSFTALADIDLVLESGTRAALVGPNGSGKSTLVRMAMGMLAGTGGIRLGGIDPWRDWPALAHRVVYVPQIAPRFWAPVREVVAAVARLRRIDRDRIAAIAKRFDLDLEALAARPFRALSGGMRQKVLAALSLAARSELLLLDEPTASMDPRSRAVFFELLDELPGAPTVVLCSHRVEEIRRQVEQVVVLADGRLQWHGPTDTYLGTRTEAVVEVAVRGDEAARWLDANGFASGRSGWWTRSVATAARADAVREVLHQIDGSIVDLMVRDHDRATPGTENGA